VWGGPLGRGDKRLRDKKGRGAEGGKKRKWEQFMTSGYSMRQALIRGRSLGGGGGERGERRGIRNGKELGERRVGWWAGSKRKLVRVGGGCGREGLEDAMSEQADRWQQGGYGGGEWGGKVGGVCL